MSPHFFAATALAACAFAAISDARKGVIPNALTIPFFIGAVATHAMSGVAGLAQSLLGAVAAGLVPAVMFWKTGGRAIGGGDVKLLAGLGAMLGPAPGLEVEFSAFTVLCLFALMRLAYRGRLIAVFVNAVWILLNPILPARHRREVDPEALTEMRMGPAVFVSLATVSLVEGWLS